jgi:rubrerythrin
MSAISRRHFCIVLLGTILTPLSLPGAGPTYPVTVKVLQALFRDEMLAYAAYLAYSGKAVSEGFPNLGHFFKALAFSESIHARNVKQALSVLGVEVDEEPLPEIKILSSQENLRHATEAELQEIDRKYPQSIEAIRPEGREEAIRALIHAWEGEKQHRGMVDKMRAGTGILWGALINVIERTPRRYFVCQACGSTLTQLPKDICPICQGAVTRYNEVEKTP